MKIIQILLLLMVTFIGATAQNVSDPLTHQSWHGLYHGNLKVEGDIKFTKNAVSGYRLTCDGNGNASWQPDLPVYGDYNKDLRGLPTPPYGITETSDNTSGILDVAFAQIGIRGRLNANLRAVIGLCTYGANPYLFIQAGDLGKRWLPTVLGGGGDVGIGISAPTAKFHVVGSIRFQTGQQGAGKIWQSDANGIGDWVTILQYDEELRPSAGATSFRIAHIPKGDVSIFKISNGVTTKILKSQYSIDGATIKYLGSTIINGDIFSVSYIY